MPRRVPVSDGDTRSEAAGSPSQNLVSPSAGGRARAGRPARPLLRLGLIVLIAYGVWCAGLYFCQDALIFPADVAPEPIPRPLTRPLSEQVVVHEIFTPEGRNEAWFLPAPGASKDRPAPAVVFLHGNAELIDYQDHVIYAYHRLGVSVLLPEYRGYGAAAGKPSQAGILEDNLRFYDWLVHRPEVAPDKVVIHGRSLGGGVACDLATRRPPAALVLESTFTSAAALANRYLAPSFLCKYPFRNDLALRHLTCPVLIGHGRSDQIIPVSHGRALRDQVGHAVYKEYDCDHNGFPGATNEDDWWETIRTFLAGAGITRSTVVAASQVAR